MWDRGLLANGAHQPDLQSLHDVGRALNHAVPRQQPAGAPDASNKARAARFRPPVSRSAHTSSSFRRSLIAPRR
jgi:hypothetical protein